MDGETLAEVSGTSMAAEGAGFRLHTDVLES